jgi:DNA repair protein SbcD/Mre11
MRVAHLADTHLGYRRFHYADGQGRNIREADVYRAFEEAIEKIIELDVDAVVHSGDLFEAFHPSTYALGHALDGFAKLRDAGIPAVVIAGNHSTPTRSTSAHVFSLLRRFGAHAIFDEPECIRLDDLAVTGVPHLHDRARLLEEIAKATPDPDAQVNILALHVGLDRLPGAGSHEVSAVELDPEALEETAEFDYVALGHLHEFSPISDNAAYAGSIERLGFYDTASEKGFALVDFDARGTRDFVQLIPVQTRLCRELPEIDASGQDDLLASITDALKKVSLPGSVLRLPLVGVEQSAWRAMDRRALRDLVKDCLHFEPQVEFAGTAAPVVGGAVDLHSFISEHANPKLDSAVLLERATAYMDRATRELQEAGDE